MKYCFIKIVSLINMFDFLERQVNRIIAFQSNCNVILLPITLSFLCGLWWDLGGYITKHCCYFGTYLGIVIQCT